MKIKDALEKLDRAKKAAVSMRDKAEQAAEKSMGTLAIVGGGALGGFLDSRYPTVWGVDTGWVAGGLLTAVGIFGVAGKHSDLISDAGAGVLAYEVGLRVAATAKVKPEKEVAVGYMSEGRRVRSLTSGSPRLEDVLPGVRQSVRAA